jgi:hypothetical protein
MTNANMQLAVISVTMEDKLETPVPQLDAGEHIVTRVVELAHLQDALNGKQFSRRLRSLPSEIILFPNRV